MNKRKLLPRLSVLASQKKLRKSVLLKLKPQRLPPLLKLIGCARKKNSARRRKNSSTRKKNLKRKLHNWQHLQKLKHL